MVVKKDGLYGIFAGDGSEKVPVNYKGIVQAGDGNLFVEIDTGWAVCKTEDFVQAINR